MSAVRSRPARDQRPPLLTEVTVVVFLCASLAGFERVFKGDAWLGPVFVTALGLMAVGWLTRRRLASPIVAAPLEVVSLLLLVAWTVIPSTTTFGLPLRPTWRYAGRSLRGLSSQFDFSSVPAEATHSFLLLAATGSGVIALLTTWIILRSRHTLLGMVPGLAVFVACCSLGTSRGRLWTVCCEVGAGGLLLLCDRTGPAASETQWLGSKRAGGVMNSLHGGLAAVLVGVVVAAIVVPALPKTDGKGPLGWRTFGVGAPRLIPSPIVSLQTRLLQESGVKVMTVTSSVPSYWRLTSLAQFNGVEWNAADTYQHFKTRLPGIGATPAGARRVVEHFDIQALESAWLPLAFNPVQVSGAGPVSYDSSSGSLLTPKPTSDGLNYTVTSLESLALLSAAKLSAVPAVKDDAMTAEYLALPSSVPADVRALARQIVKGKTTEYAKALALQDYFYGPQFTYSLNPPSDGTGDQALQTFLFQTKTGYCQQFAGSYAVLARVVGLPTRLAFGFTTGQEIRPGVYQVTDADAHTWPEVWFPKVGWVPFEPTKGTFGHGFAIPGAARYTGNTAKLAAPSGPNGSSSTSTSPSSRATVPPGRTATTTTPPSTSGQPLRSDQIDRNLGGPRGSAGARPTSTKPAAHHRRPASSRAGLLLAAWIAAALILAGLAVMLANRLVRAARWHRRWRAASGAGPESVAAAQLGVVWDQVAEQLSWVGLRRRRSETIAEFVQRADYRLRYAREVYVGDDLRRLADLVTRATYGEETLDAEDVAAAASEARDHIFPALRLEATHRERLRVVFDPRLAWAAR